MSCAYECPKPTLQNIMHLCPWCKEELGKRIEEHLCWMSKAGCNDRALGGEMNLGELEFLAIDFQGLGIPLGTDLTPLAERANQLLRERLEKAEQIEGKFISHALGNVIEWYYQYDDYTHTARLVCIEELKK